MNSDKTPHFYKIPQKFIEKYTRTNYRVVGKFKHTAIKPCYWLEQKLLTGRTNRNCYKGYFGIESELCIQNSPAYPFCNHQCVFCWRDMERGSLGSKFIVEPDDPVFLVDELIRHQRNMISHYYGVEKNLANYELSKQISTYCWKNITSGPHSTGKLCSELGSTKSATDKAILLLKNTGVMRTDDMESYLLTKNAVELLQQLGGDIDQLLKQVVTTPTEIKAVHEKAMNPHHAAISLDGEPTLYPFIGEYISEFRKRGFTTFIVTNGSNPDVIRRLDETGCLPSQLYITIPVPNENDYQKICRPKQEGVWDRIQQTIGMVKDLKTRTCARITSVKGLNIRADLVESYVKFIQNMQPNFLDIKGFTLEGASLKIADRVGGKAENTEFVPDFNYLMDFAKKLSQVGGFEIIETHEKSRDILLRINWPKDKSIKITANQI